jgi:hypothetical protein
LKLTEKGKRLGQEHTWKGLLGVAASAVSSAPGSSGSGFGGPA